MTIIVFLLSLTSNQIFYACISYFGHLHVYVILGRFDTPFLGWMNEISDTVIFFLGGNHLLKAQGVPSAFPVYRRG